MDKQRLPLFIALVILIWGGTILARVWFAPPPKPVAKAPAKKGDEAGQKPAPAQPKPATPEAKPSGKPADSAVPKTTEPKAKPVDKAAEKPPVMPAPPPAPPLGAPRQMVTLGSMDPASGYAMLITLDSLGASVLRAELNSPTYRDLADKTGYLGKLHFAAEKSKDGLEVLLVGPGTPAGAAGLAPGDRLHKINGQSLTEIAQLEAFLRGTKPGDKVTLGVRRAADGKPQELNLTTTLSSRPLEIIRPVKDDPNSLLFALTKVGDVLSGPGGALPKFDAPASYSWTLDEQGPGFAQFSLLVDDAVLGVAEKGVKLKLVKRYELAKSGEKSKLNNHLNLKVEIHNQSERPQGVAYRLDGPHSLPLEGWWYTTKLHPTFMYTAGARDVLLRRRDGGHELLGCSAIYAQAKKSYDAKPNKPVPATLPFIESSEPAALDYVGVDTQYFAVVLKPGQTEPTPAPAEGSAAARSPTPIFSSGVARTIEPKSIIQRRQSPYIRTTNVSFRLATNDQPLAAGGVLRHDYLVFMGPKELELLGEYQLDKCVEFGWSIFAVPAKVLGSLLHLLYAIIPNYGVAIILLTIIVRTIMVPISIKQAKNAALMQAMAPEMAEVRKRFPDDLAKQHELNQEIQARYGVNPLSGCLPLFIQMPILMGLYRAISTDINLRGAALIPGWSWSSNLAAPDQLFYWKPYLWPVVADEGLGYLGPYFNLFPLATVALFLVQQKLFSPPAVDEQSKQQAMTMNIMSVMFAWMFFKVPAGLCLYFITTTIWSIVERQLIPKPTIAASGEIVVDAKPSAEPNRDADNRRRERKAKAKRK